MKITPPAAPGAPAAVDAVVKALPNETGLAFGEAIWVKVFVTESSAPAVLEDLVAGNPAVPGRDANGDLIETETETEWVLLQAGGDEQLDTGAKDMAHGSESITRRYEYYEYVGGYNPEDHEALHDVPGTLASPELYVGNFVGSSNVAVNLQPFAIPEPASLGVLALGAATILSRRRRR